MQYFRLKTCKDLSHQNLSKSKSVSHIQGVIDNKLENLIKMIS